MDEFGSLAHIGTPELLEFASSLLAMVRKEKSEAKMSMTAPVVLMRVCDTPERLDLLSQFQGDLIAAGTVVGTLEKIECPSGTEAKVEVTLAGN